MKRRKFHRHIQENSPYTNVWGFSCLDMQKYSSMTVEAAASEIEKTLKENAGEQVINNWTAKFRKDMQKAARDEKEEFIRILALVAFSNTRDIDKTTAILFLTQRTFRQEDLEKLRNKLAKDTVSNVFKFAEQLPLLKEAKLFAPFR